MDEKQAVLLEQYDLEVYRANRKKGAWLLETNQGMKLFGTCPLSEGKVAFEQKIKNYIAKQGGPKVDHYVPTREGNYLVQGPYSEWFVMRDWVDGEECDVQNIVHIEETVRTLARLHQVLVGVELSGQEREFCIQPKLKELLERRNRELRRVRTYIRGKKQKSVFEQKFLQQFSELYEQAERATGLLKEQEYDAYYDSVINAGVMLHGNYTHHSVLLGMGETVVTGFQKTSLGIQVHDFYLLFRKMMEKWDWNITLGEKMLSAYEEVRPFPKQERELLYLLLSYPEKFWKVANQYYNNRKSWVPEKNMQKLVQTLSQAEQKEETIQRLFT